jgi:hypothetical protein
VTACVPRSKALPYGAVEGPFSGARPIAEAPQLGKHQHLLPRLVLRNVLFAVVIPLGMTPGMALSVVLDGARWPVLISIVPLQLS